MPKPTYLVALVIAFFAVAETASAAVAPDHLANRPELEVSHTLAKPRIARTFSATAPLLSRQTPTGHLRSGSWTTMWDQGTGVASAIYGSGIDVPNSMTDPRAAERFARAFLAEQLDILAPGASAGDFLVVANHLGDGIRTIGFAQTHSGLRVVGGQIALRFKNGRMIAVTSQALPNVAVGLGPLARGPAQTAALQWIDRDFDTIAELKATSDSVILPIVSSSGRISYHQVVPVTVTSAAPIGKWTVYVGVDAEPLARRQLLKFATGTVNYNVPSRWPGGAYVDLPASATSINVDGANQVSNAAGVVTFGGANAAIVTSLTGDFVRVANQQGGNASSNFTLADGGSISWVFGMGDEFGDAQLATFIHANIAKERARILNPGLAYLNERLTANVNIGDSCNAFADGGESINMFQANAQCGNTGRLADVVYHEFGHNLHGNSIIPGAGAFDGAFSEGLSDYFAGSITGDPAMGVGFFHDERALRHMDETDFVWPDDVSQIHQTGRIFATTMWDIRKLMIAKMGETAGAAYTNKLFYAAVQRSADIPGTALEILVADDDDGNLANGTPNQCDIEEVLAAHGLAADVGGSAPGLDFPLHDGYEIAVPVLASAGACEPASISSMTLSWRLGGETTDRENLPMSLTGDRYSAQIPSQAPNQVIEYKVKVSYADGAERNLPKNNADPYYQFYNGATTELYCTDFSTDPTTDWTVLGTGASAWEWGMPSGGSGGPLEPYAGTNIFATGIDKRYTPTTDVTATTPAIDTSGHNTVRLQYRRWLGVEDATYDTARITVNSTVVWTNANNGAGDLTHNDREWRFHDVDISAQAASGSVTLSFGLRSDEGLEFSGWNLDQLCIVATAPPPVCGDGLMDEGEACDDGNDIDDDDCSNVCVPGDGGGGCGCQSSGGGGQGIALLLFAVFFGYVRFGYVRRNRKRRAR